SPKPSISKSFSLDRPENTQSTCAPTSASAFAITRARVRCPLPVPCTPYNILIHLPDRNADKSPETRSLCPAEHLLQYHWDNERRATPGSRRSGWPIHKRAGQ